VITHHGWRVSVCDVVPSASLARPWAPAPKVCDDFSVLAAALDCCRVLHEAGRVGIELQAIEQRDGREELHPLNWRELIATAASGT
jgi:hypothetical protein